MASAVCSFGVQVEGSPEPGGYVRKVDTVLVCPLILRKKFGVAWHNGTHLRSSEDWCMVAYRCSLCCCRVCYSYLQMQKWPQDQHRKRP